MRLPLVDLALPTVRVLALQVLALQVLTLAVLFSAAFASGGVGDGPRLRVATEDGEILLDISLADGAEWIVRWNHSVTGIVVSDYYRLEGEQMLLSASHTPAFDAGLGHIPGRGTVESDGSHGYWIRDIDEPVVGNSYTLRVGSPRVNHRIVHAGASYSLTELAAGRRVTIEVTPVEVTE